MELQIARSVSENARGTACLRLELNSLYKGYQCDSQYIWLISYFKKHKQSNLYE